MPHAPTPSPSMPQAPSQPLSTVTPPAQTKLAPPLASYSHARRVGDLLFVAGQGCRHAITNSYAGLTQDSDGKVLSYDIGAQTQAVLGNIEAVLGVHGLDRRALVDIQVFLADMADFARMNEVWNEFFREAAPPPTRTTVAVRQLPGLNFVEMKAIASFSARSNAVTSP